METKSRHNIFICLLACTAAVLLASSCGRHDEELPPEGRKATLLFHIGTIGQTRAGDDNDHEKMHSLRIIVTDAEGKMVEYNEHISFSEARTSYTYECTTWPGKKKIYLIANEESVQYDDADGNTTGTTGKKSLHELLNGITAGYIGFGTLINSIVFEPAYTQTTDIPMSSEYDIEVEKDKSRQECTLYVVRVATKFTINIENYRDKQIKLTGFTIESVADKNYLMPHLNTADPLFNGYATWIDWLRKVSEDSQINPNNPTADDAGWLQDYDLPGDATRKTYRYSAEEGITIPAKTADDKPGTNNPITVYIPESINLKEGSSEHGEQEYKMSFTVDEEQTESKPLPNLKALFRNTHVLVTVRFGKGAEVIYGGIVYWGFYDSVTGTVEKEEDESE